LEVPRMYVADHSHVEAKHREPLGCVYLNWILISRSSAQKKVAAPVGGNDQRISSSRLVAERPYKVSVPVVAVAIGPFDPLGPASTERDEVLFQVHQCAYVSGRALD